MRIAYAGIELPRNLPSGRHVELDQDKMKSLYKEAGLAL
jgi:hypothetical protein